MSQDNLKRSMRISKKSKKAMEAELMPMEEFTEDSSTAAAATTVDLEMTHPNERRVSSGRKSDEKTRNDGEKEKQSVEEFEAPFEDDSDQASPATSEDENPQLGSSRLKGIKSLWKIVSRQSRVRSIPRSQILMAMAASSKTRAPEEFTDKEKELVSIGFNRWQMDHPEKSKDQAPSDFNLMILEYRRLIEEESARETGIEAGTLAERAHNTQESNRRKSAPKETDPVFQDVETRKGLRKQPQKTTERAKVSEAKKKDAITMAIHAPNVTPPEYSQGKFWEGWSLPRMNNYLNVVNEFQEGKESSHINKPLIPGIERRLTDNYFYPEEMKLCLAGLELFNVQKRYRILRLKADGPGRSGCLEQCERELFARTDQFYAATRALKATEDYTPLDATTIEARREVGPTEGECAHDSSDDSRVIDLRGDDSPGLEESDNEAETARLRKRLTESTRKAAERASSWQARERERRDFEDLPHLQQQSDDSDDDDDYWQLEQHGKAAKLRASEDPGETVRGVQCISEEDFEFRRRTLDREQRLLDELREQRQARGRSSASAAAYTGTVARDRSRESSRTRGSVQGGDSDDEGGSKRRIVVTTENCLRSVPLFNLKCMQDLWKDFNLQRSSKPTAKEIFKAMEPKCEEQLFAMIKWSAADAVVRTQLGDPLRVKKDWDADRIFKMSSLLLQGRVGPYQVQNSQISMDAHFAVAFGTFVWKATAEGNSEFQQVADRMLLAHGEPTIGDALRGVIMLSNPPTLSTAINLRKQGATCGRLLLKSAELSQAYCPLYTALERTGVMSTTAIVDMERFIFLRDWFLYFMEEMAIVSHALLDGLRLGLVLRGGTKRDWELSRTQPTLSPFDYHSPAGGERNEKRPREGKVIVAGAAAGTRPYKTGTEEPCTVCNRTHPGECLLRDHTDANTASGRLWKDHERGKKGLTLNPPMTALNATYSMSGAILPETLRQSLSDTRNKVMGRDIKKVRPQHEIQPWGSSSGSQAPRRAATAPSERASRHPPTQGESARVINTAQDPHTQVELCECVEACGREQLTSYTNKCLVTLSAKQNVPVVDNAQAPKAPDTTDLAVATSPSSIDTVARLDTGANCNDYISRELANKLIEMGSPVIPMTGRVCGAFKRVGRVMTSRILCNYKFINVHTLLQEEIVIEPVVLDDLIAPLIVGLQTIGQYNLLHKQLPTLCQDIVDTKFPLTRSPSNGALRVAKRAIGVTPAQLALHIEHRAPDRVLNLLLSEREGGTRCDLCVLQVSSKDYFGERDDSESDSETPPPAINELLPSVTDGEGTASMKVSRNEYISFRSRVQVFDKKDCAVYVHDTKGSSQRASAPLLPTYHQ